ncbi:hypothetical protein JGH11_04410 [Dysgonomonas sp. Marseille-P4677]|uniref:hypothetical protein n=1 Tax=Dysgonomonas sp. Marseille-P4677 TaxID=2364790 RepID=UPI001911D149|nr:hypothetical protein [Dysgonomonas sp. Marseille-P4677]MBK5720109.1 hypothetical protein [Dysgonomonas sp. Marseille-P4677]
MKKLILVMALLASICSFAQNKEILKDINKVEFYGVDFSHVKVYEAKESSEQFKIAFQDINNLFISEAKKYNVSKALNREVAGVHVDNVKDRAYKIDTKDLFTSNADYQIEDNTIKDILKSLEINEKEGTGVILIAIKLNKLQNRGYYRVVFFDIKTRDVIDSWNTDGKARGFGLRNFWAHSVYNVLKDMNLK